jgi:hypothetical protein
MGELQVAIVARTFHSPAGAARTAPGDDRHFSVSALVQIEQVAGMSFLLPLFRFTSETGAV